MNSSISDISDDMSHLIGCEIAPRQGVFFRRLPHTGKAWDKVDMSGEPIDLAAFREALGREMKRKKIAAKTLSKVAGLGETAVRDIMNSKDGPRVSTLIKLADALDVPASNLLGGQVPVLGKVGAGGTVLFEESDEPELVDRPPGAPRHLMALKVTGDSMMPVYRDGDIIYVERIHEGVLPEYVGEECAVHTVDGGTFLKVLANGTQYNRFTLRSFNAADMENVELVWASPVLFVMRNRKRPANE